MRTFDQFLEFRQFHADACEALTDPDFYALAKSMYEALETIADPGTAEQTHYRTILTLRSHAKNALMGYR